MTTRGAILQTAGTMLLMAMATLAFDHGPWFWFILACLLSAILAIWVEAWSKK